MGIQRSNRALSERHNLIAFMATLAAIVALVITGAIMASQGKPAEALGIGGAVTGLIGVIGTFKPRSGGLSEDNEKKLIDKVPPRTGEANQGQQS